MRPTLGLLPPLVAAACALAACEEKKPPRGGTTTFVYSDACAPAPASEGTAADAGSSADAGERLLKANEDAVEVKLDKVPARKVAIDFDMRVKMRDGVELSADVYRPETDGHYPVVLMRTPYGKADERTVKKGRNFAAHGFVYLAMDVRGRGDSDGKFVHYVNDGIDGYDAIEWAAVQPWSSGKVGTIGGSYPGRIQWLTALTHPPHLVSMVPMVTPSDPFVEFPTGVPLPLDAPWYHVTAGRVNQVESAVDWTKLLEHLPLVTLDEAAGRPNPLWKELFEHTTLDAYWQSQRYQDKFDKLDVPTFHISGWYDDEQMGTPLNFAGMTTKGQLSGRRQQRLLMGSWGHALNTKRVMGKVDFGPDAIIDLDGAILRWFDATLKEIPNGMLQEPPVRVFVMGDNRWIDENEWPIARTRFTKYYLHSKGKANTLGGDGTLSTIDPVAEPFDKYRYDPMKPVPFITDPSFAQIGGPDDYRAVEKRDDVLVYTTDAIKDELLLCGPVKVELWAQSSAKDTDFMAKLVDVWPDGYAQRLTDGMVRARFRNGMEKPALIEPGKAYQYVIDAWNTCQKIKKGHRIRVEIASSAFPKYDRNPNTGAPLGMTKDVQPAEQTVLHDREHPSAIVLPIVPAK